MTTIGPVDLSFRNDHWDLPHGLTGPQRSLYAGTILVGWVQGAASEKFSAWLMTSQMGEMLGLYETEEQAKSELLAAAIQALIH